MHHKSSLVPSQAQNLVVVTPGMSALPPLAECATPEAGEAGTTKQHVVT